MATATLDAEQAEWLADVFVKLTILNRDARELEKQHSALAEATKGKKKALEAKQEEIQALIDQVNADDPPIVAYAKANREAKESATATEPIPASDVIDVEFLPAISGPVATPEELAEAARGEPATEPEQDPDAWRTVTVADLVAKHGLSKAIGTKLAEAGILTVGDIAGLRDDRKALTDLPGIGDSAAEKIMAAMDRLWTSMAPKGGDE